MSELADYEVVIPMVRRIEGERVEHLFNFVIPAVDDEAATRGAYDMGHGINAASDHQWKFSERPISVRRRSIAETVAAAIEAEVGSYGISEYGDSALPDWIHREYAPYQKMSKEEQKAFEQEVSDVIYG